MTSMKRNLSVLSFILVPVLLVAAAFWTLNDRVDNMQNVPAAVVNLDEIIMDDDIGPMAVGRLVAAALTSPEGDVSTGFDWSLVSEESATSGLADGTYQAAVVIPKDFSQSIVDLTSAAAAGSGASTTTGASAGADAASELQAAEIQVLTNESQSALGALLSQQVANIASQQVGQQITVSYIDGLHQGFTTLSDELGGAADGVHTLADGTTQLAAGTDELASGAEQFSSATGELASGTDELNAGVGALDSGAQVLSSGASELSQGAAEVASGTQELASATAQIYGGQQELNTGLQEFSSGVSQLHTGLSQVAEQAAALPEAGTGILEGSSGISSGLSELSQGVAELTQLCAMYPEDDPLCAALTGQVAPGLADLDLGASQFDAGLGQYVGGINELVAGVQLIGENTATLAEGASELAGGSAELTTGLGQVSQGMNELSAGSSQLAGGASQVSQGTSELASGTRELGAGTAELAAGAGTLSEFAGDLHGGAAELAEGMHSADEGVQELAGGLDQATEQIPSFTPERSAELSEHIAAPVTSNHTETQPIANSLSLYAATLLVAAIFLGTLVWTLTRRWELPAAGSVSGLGQRLWKPIRSTLAVSATQALLLVVFVWLIGVEFASVWKTLTMLAVTVVVASAVNLGLCLGTKRLGRLFAIAFFFLQLFALSTILPLDSAPPGLQMLSQVLPLPVMASAVQSATLGTNIVEGAVLLVAVVWVGVSLLFMWTNLRRQELISWTRLLSPRTS